MCVCKFDLLPLIQLDHLLHSSKDALKDLQSQASNSQDGVKL